MTDWRLAWGAAAAAVLGATAVAQDELLIALDEAPADALAAAQAAQPDVSFDGADVEVEDGVVTLEFQGSHADGRRVEVDVAMGWRVLEIEDVIALDETPEAVRDALAVALPDFAPSTVERSARGEAIVYEFEGVGADGGEVDVEIKAEGDSVVVLDDDDT